jgi:hypothetical protein
VRLFLASPVVCALFLTSFSLTVGLIYSLGPIFGATVAAAGAVAAVNPNLFLMYRNRSADEAEGNTFNPPNATNAYQLPAAADAPEFDEATLAGSRYFAAAEVEVYLCK